MEYVRPAAVDGHYVLQDVVVVDVLTGACDGGQDLEVRGGKIIAIGPTGADHGELGTVAGDGAFVVPGFVDSHAHALDRPEFQPASYALMLAAGVVGFRQMNGSPELLERRRRGELPDQPGAPALLATSGALLNPLNASTAEQVTAEVRRQHEQGADFIKAGMTNRVSFLAALAEATRWGLPLAGHLPTDIDPREAAEAGVHCIEHFGTGVTVFAAACGCEAEIRAEPGRLPRLPTINLPGMTRVFARILRRLVTNPSTITSPRAARQLALADESFEESKARELAALFVARQTWQCPTLVRQHTQYFADQPVHRADPRLRYIAPAQRRSWAASAARYAKLPAQTREALVAHWQANLRLTKIMGDAGAPMIAGTDANGAGWIIPGFGLHDEFDHLAEAGLSPLTILQQTTSAPAKFFERPTAGQVLPGRDADLVLLGADPVHDHRALHEIRAVVRGGALWSRTALDEVLDRLARKPAAG